VEDGRDSGAATPDHYVRGVPAGGKLVVAAFVVLTVGWPTLADESFAAVRDAISDSAGWFYGFVVSMALLLCLLLMLGPWGSVRLGSDAERPEFGWLSWTSMLFAAGMGIVSSSGPLPNR
jgi:choline-glycine betaine transporter